MTYVHTDAKRIQSVAKEFGVSITPSTTEQRFSAAQLNVAQLADKGPNIKWLVGPHTKECWIGLDHDKKPYVRFE